MKLGARWLTLEFDVPVNDVLVVKIGHGAHKLGEHAADEGWRKKLAMTSRHVKQIPTGVVTKHEDCSGRLDTPGLEVHERRVPYRLHDLELPLQAHLDAVLGRTPSGAMLADLNGYQGPAFG